ncbi:MFS transporter [Micromonospora sp. CPCC 205539]|uniref:MFS transporter n=1 Tax=Micromonospora sp. CPCC 205539 TaxID=3122408 RepID=UPI003FA608A0
MTRAPGDDRRRLRPACTAQAAIGFSATSLGAVLVLLARDLDTGPGKLAWLPSAFGAGLVIVAVAGPFLLRDGPRLALRVGGIALGAGAVLLAVTTTRTVATIGALSLGFGAAALVLVTPALLTGPGAARQLSLANAAASTAAVAAPAVFATADLLTGRGRSALLALAPLTLVLIATSPPARGSNVPSGGRRHHRRTSGRTRENPRHNRRRALPDPSPRRGGRAWRSRHRAVRRHPARGREPGRCRVLCDPVRDH